MDAAGPGVLEGRPAPADVSPLQARIDAAPSGGTVEVLPGVYEGDVCIDRPLTVVGRGRPRLLGSRRGSVVRIRASGVTVEGFDIDGRRGGDLSLDSSGVHVSGRGAVVRDCRIIESLFGVYLREAAGARVEGCTVHGIPGLDPGEKGSGIHVWNTTGFAIVKNDLVDVRDGLYVQSSSRGTIHGNRVRDVRYGLHYMYSDDNVFEDNVFENAAAGTVLMYSRRIEFRRNRFIHNRGFASVGLLFKACDDSIAEDNLIADNARGIFLEGSYRNVFRRNVIAESDAAVVLYDSCGSNRFLDNSFVGNLSPLTLVGRRTDTSFDGNFWSDNDEPDLDGDGRSDRPFVLGSLFDHLRGNLTAADLLSQSAAATALAAAERGFPVLRAIEVSDRSPLVRPPHLPAVPSPRLGARHSSLRGLAGSLAAIVVGAAVLVAGGRGGAA